MIIYYHCDKIQRYCLWELRQIKFYLSIYIHLYCLYFPGQSMCTYACQILRLRLLRKKFTRKEIMYLCVCVSECVCVCVYGRITRAVVCNLIYRLYSCVAKCVCVCVCVCIRGCVCNRRLYPSNSDQEPLRRVHQSGAEAALYSPMAICLNIAFVASNPDLVYTCLDAHSYKNTYAHVSDNI